MYEIPVVIFTKSFLNSIKNYYHSVLWKIKLQFILFVSCIADDDEKKKIEISINFIFKVDFNCRNVIQTKVNEITRSVDNFPGS